MINNVLIYIRQHSQLKQHEPHHYLQPPTQCQFCLESTNASSSCDEQPAVMRILVPTQRLHSLDSNTLVQPSRLEKKTRVYRHHPQVNACQVLLRPKGNHSRPPGGDWWPAITQLSRLAILRHPFCILHPSAHSLDTSTFGSTKPLGKKDAGL